MPGANEAMGLLNSQKKYYEKQNEARKKKLEQQKIEWKQKATSAAYKAPATGVLPVKLYKSKSMMGNTGSVQEKIASLRQQAVTQKRNLGTVGFAPANVSSFGKAQIEELGKSMLPVAQMNQAMYTGADNTILNSINREELDRFAAAAKAQRDGSKATVEKKKEAAANRETLMRTPQSQAEQLYDPNTIERQIYANIARGKDPMAGIQTGKADAKTTGYLEQLYKTIRTDQELKEIKKKEENSSKKQYLDQLNREVLATPQNQTEQLYDPNTVERQIYANMAQGKDPMAGIQTGKTAEPKNEYKDKLEAYNEEAKKQNAEAVYTDQRARTGQYYQLTIEANEAKKKNAKAYTEAVEQGKEKAGRITEKPNVLKSVQRGNGFVVDADQLITAQEKETLAYLYGTGEEEKAEQYKRILTRYANARKAQLFEQGMDELFKEDTTGQKIGAGVTSALSRMVSGIPAIGETIEQSARNAKTGENEMPDMNEDGYYLNAYSRKAEELATRNLAPTAKSLVSMGIGLGGSLPALAIGAVNPIAGSAYSAANAAGNAAYDAGIRGGTLDQMTNTALATGVTEMLTNYLPLDKLSKGLKGTSTAQTALQRVKRIAGQAAAEGGQEASAQALEILQDYLIMGDKSNFSQYMKAYLDEHPEAKQDEAFMKALVNSAKEIGLSFGIGAAMGGAVQGIGELSGRIKAGELPTKSEPITGKTYTGKLPAKKGGAEKSWYLKGDGSTDYDLVYRKAGKLQEEVNRLSEDISAKLGLAYEAAEQKSVTSMMNKTARKQAQGKPYTVLDMKDHARNKILIKDYSQIADVERILQEKGIAYETEVVGPTMYGYRGYHITYRNADGLGAELQLATPEAWKVKLESDKIYEKWRNVNPKQLSTTKRQLYKQEVERSLDLWDQLNLPDFMRLSTSLGVNNLPLRTVSRTTMGGSALPQRPPTNSRKSSPFQKGSMSINRPDSVNTKRGSTIKNTPPFSNIIHQQGSEVNTKTYTGKLPTKKTDTQQGKINAEDIQATMQSTDTADIPVKVGKNTVIQHPYRGETPSNTAKATREKVTVGEQTVAEAKAKMAEAASSGQGYSKTLRESFREMFNRNPKQVQVKNATFAGEPYTVQVGNRAFGKLLGDRNPSAEKFSLLGNLKEIIENGEYVGSGRYAKNNQNKAESTIRYDYFETDVNIGGKNYIASFDVEVFKTKNNFRTYRINEIDLTPKNDGLASLFQAAPIRNGKSSLQNLTHNDGGGSAIVAGAATGKRSGSNLTPNNGREVARLSTVAIEKGPGSNPAPINDGLVARVATALVEKGSGSNLTPNNGREVAPVATVAIEKGSGSNPAPINDGLVAPVATAPVESRPGSITYTMPSGKKNVKENVEIPVSSRLEDQIGTGKVAVAGAKQKKDIKGSIINTARSFYQNAVSDTAPLERAAKIQKKIDKGAVNLEDSVQQVRTAGGTVDYNLETSLTDIDGNAVGKSWKKINEIIPKGKNKAEQLKNDEIANLYLLHKHNIDRQAQGKPVFGESAEQSRAIIKQIEQRYPWAAEYGKEVRSFVDTFMEKWGVEGGLIKKETYQKMREMYPNYVPTYRSKYQGKRGQFGSGGTSIPSAVKKATGDVSTVTDIRDSIAGQVNKMVKLERKNELLANLYHFAKTNPDAAADYAVIQPSGKTSVFDVDADGIDAVDQGLLQKTADAYTVTAYINGEPVKMRVAADIYNGLERLFNSDVTKLEEIGKKLTGIPKRYITGVNPFFAIRNIVRDVQTGYSNSIVSNPLKFVKQYGVATKKMAQKSPEFQQFKALGGDRSGYYTAELGFVKSANRDKGIKSLPRKASDALGWLGSKTETVSRFAEYLNAIEKYGNTAAGRRKAIQAAADVTVNFARSGKMTKAVDSWVMYLNAGVQGLDKMARQLKAHPVKTLTKGIVPGIFLESFLAFVGKNDENPHYKDLDNRTKDLYFCIPNLFDKDEQGYPKSFIKVPKGREYGVTMVSLLERICRAVEGDEEAFEGYLENAMQNTLPANPVTDNVLAPIFINLPQNEDFAGRSIVPKDLEDLSPKYQYDAKTSELAKAIGEATNISPKQIDYLIKSYGGFLGEAVLPIMTAAEKPQSVGEAIKQMALNPITSAFTADPKYQSAIMDKFYRDKEEATRAAKDEGFEQNIPDEYVTPAEKKVSIYNSIQKDISDLSKKEKEIIGMDLSNEEKKKRIDELREQKIALARGAKQKAEEEAAEYAKIYVPEISMLSDKRQEAARTLHDDSGIEYADFADICQATKGYKGDKDESGKTIKYSKGLKVKAYIDRKNLSAEQKEALYDAFDVSSAIWDEDTSNMILPEPEEKEEELGDAEDAAKETTDTTSGGRKRAVNSRGNTPKAAEKTGVIKQARELTASEQKEIETSEKFKRTGISAKDYKYIQDRYQGYKSHERAGWLEGLGLQGDELRNAVKEFAMTASRKAKMQVAQDNGIDEKYYIDLYIAQKDYNKNGKEKYLAQCFDYIEALPLTAEQKELLYSGCKYYKP